MEDWVAACPGPGGEVPFVAVGPDVGCAWEGEWGGEEGEGGGGEEDVDGEVGAVTGVEGGDEEWEFDGCDGTGAGEE